MLKPIDGLDYNSPVTIAQVPLYTEPQVSVSNDSLHFPMSTLLCSLWSFGWSCVVRNARNLTENSDMPENTNEKKN